MVLGIGLLAAATAGCGTVDPGAYEGVRDLKLDENYYYCVVQPQVVTPKKCSSGEAGEGASACHGNNTSMRLKEVAKSVDCSGGKPTATVSQEERDNYAAAQIRASRDVEAAPLLTYPTQQTGTLHPRQIFTSDSPEATIIRQWIKGGK
jgi:hypothetical protein